MLPSRGAATAAVRLVIFERFVMAVSLKVCRNRRFIDARGVDDRGHGAVRAITRWSKSARPLSLPKPATRGQTRLAPRPPVLSDTRDRNLGHCCLLTVWTGTPRSPPIPHVPSKVPRKCGAFLLGKLGGRGISTIAQTWFRSAAPKRTYCQPGTKGVHCSF